MTKTAEITPLPWSVEGFHGRSEKIVQESDKGVCIAVMPQWEPSYYDEKAANAAYIVRACNNFPKLVEALRLCNRILLQTVRDEYVDDCINEATLALRAAGEEL